jgi:hypothetical protein
MIGVYNKIFVIISDRLKFVGWKENNQLNDYLIKRLQGIEALTLKGPNKSVF